jgi:hypothetical protein
MSGGLLCGATIVRRPWSENPHGRQRTLYLIYDFINICFCVLGLGIIALALAELATPGLLS